MSPKDTVDNQIALDRLETWFSGCPDAAVALSGGVDSSLVAYLARKSLGREATTAYLADSASLKRRDFQIAVEFCSEHDISLVVMKTKELENPKYAANPADRCYFCKTTLYSEMSRLLAKDGSVWLLNGTNTEDLGDYRPGLQAGDESDVRSPLSECGINKAMVRSFSQSFGLTCWDKPASPCLSSRIPYGESVTEKKLGRIEAGEELLEALGFEVARVRHYEDMAVLEVERDRLADLTEHLPRIEKEFRRLGFGAVKIDSEGFVTGKLNRSLAR